MLRCRGSLGILVVRVSLRFLFIDNYVFYIRAHVLPALVCVPFCVVTCHSCCRTFRSPDAVVLKCLADPLSRIQGVFSVGLCGVVWFDWQVVKLFIANRSVFFWFVPSVWFAFVSCLNLHVPTLCCGILRQTYIAVFVSTSYIVLVFRFVFCYGFLIRAFVQVVVFPACMACYWFFRFGRSRLIVHCVSCVVCRSVSDAYLWYISKFVCVFEFFELPL